MYLKGCDFCDNWYHYSCIGFLGTEQDAQALKFVCDKCEKVLSKQEIEEIVQQNEVNFKENRVFIEGYPFLAFQSQLKKNRSKRVKLATEDCLTAVQNDSAKDSSLLKI